MNTLYTFHERVTEPRPSWMDNRQRYYAWKLRRLLPGESMTICTVWVGRLATNTNQYQLDSRKNIMSFNAAVDYLVRMESKS